MKKFYLFLSCFFSCVFCLSQNVAINNDASIADNSAILDIKSNSKGMLTPRMTLDQRMAINSPATGLLVFQTNGVQGFYYNAGTALSPSWSFIPNHTSTWNLLGNAGTNPNTHFLGTTDNVALKFKVNNEQAGIVDSSKMNTAFGYRALNFNPNGRMNTAVGFHSLLNNTTGEYNTATGVYSMTFNMQGSYNTATGHGTLYNNTLGNYNTANGFQALAFNAQGISNTAVGHHSLLYNNTGDNNTATGVNSLYANTSGTQNTAGGVGALYANNTGSNNTATGYAALNSNTTGNANVALGAYALFRNTVGSNLVAIGDSALYNNMHSSVFYGRKNTAVGSKSLYANTEGYKNSAVGFEALKVNSTGYSNTAIGTHALSGNTTGARNTALGAEALGYGSTGSNNIGIGVIALPGGSGSYNIGIGNESLRYNSTGTYNIAIGDEALRENTTGVHNIAIGGSSVLGAYSASYMTGSNNVAVGSGSMGWNTTGFNNTALGYSANWYNQTGNYNIAIGYASNCGWPGVAGALVNATAIGSYAIVNQNNAMVLGSIEGVGNGTASVNVGIGTITPQARMHIASNSQAGAVNSQLMLEENGDDYTRITMKNTVAPTKFWDLAAYNNATNANAQMNFYYQGFGDVLSLKGNGNATLSGILTQSSDARLKKNIQPLTSSLQNLMKLTGYQYNWIEDNRDKGLQLGLLAQEVQQVFPELVKEDEKGMLSVNYNGLVPVLINAMKEQQEQIKSQNDHIKKLEERLNVLEKK